MRLAAYQFGVTGDVKQNMSVLVSAVRQAAEQKADLVIFPECAVSGYPPKNIAKAENIDFSAVDRAIKELKELSDSLGISIITGTAFFDSKYYNRAYLFSPGQTPKWYGKRAVENVTPFLSVNATAPFQTAPTCFVDASGKVPAECARNKEELLIYNFEVKAPDFGEKGRIRYSDLLTGRS